LKVELAAHCEVYGHPAVSCAKTADPIAMLLGCGHRWAQGIMR